MALKLFSHKQKRARSIPKSHSATSSCIWIDKEMYAQLKKMAEISEVPTRQLVQAFCLSGMDAWMKNQKNLQLRKKYVPMADGELADTNRRQRSSRLL